MKNGDVPLDNVLHTPGPWRVVRHNADRPGLGWILEAEPNILIGRVNDAVIEHGPYDHEPIRSERTDANARLIAAAPDLLAALTLLHDNLAEYQRINNIGGYENHDMKMARAAIAKATGK